VTNSSAPTWSNALWTWRGCCTRSCPTTARFRGLLALLLLTDARRTTRTAADGRLLLLEEQDRTRWDRQAIGEGRSWSTRRYGEAV
jgi:predicted RNA polymerase sigma factor